MAVTLAELLFVNVTLGGPGVRIFVLTFRIGDGPVMSYDLLQFLLVLGISVVAAVLLEKLLWRGTPGGLLGAFLISLIGIWLFLAYFPLVWRGDYYVDGIPLITACIGALFSLLVMHLMFGSLGRHGGEGKGSASSAQQSRAEQDGRTTTLALSSC